MRRASSGILRSSQSKEATVSFRQSLVNVPELSGHLQAIGGAIMAGVYNLVAPFTGGISIELDSGTVTQFSDRPGISFKSSAGAGPETLDVRFLFRR
jgi:hypothetical protein